MNSDWRTPIVSRRLFGELAILSCFAFAVLFVVNWLFYGFVHGDEGLMAMYGWRISLGEVPNRDFVTYFPPLTGMILGLFFKAWDPGFFAERSMVLVMAVALIWSAERLLNRFTPDPWARSCMVAFLGVGVVGSWLIPSYHWVVDIVQILALGVLLAAYRTGTHWWAGVAGVLTSLGVLALQDQGVYLVVALLACFFPWLGRGPARLRLLMAWSGGVLMVAAATGVYLLRHVSMGELYWQYFLMPATRFWTIPGIESVGGNLGFASWGSQAWLSSFKTFPDYRVPFSLFTVLFVALPLLALIVLFRAWRAKWLPPPEIGLLFAGTLAFVGAASHRLTQTNLVWAAPLPLIVCCWALGRWSSCSDAKWLRISGRLLAVLLIAASFVFAIGKTRVRDSVPPVVVSGPAGALTVPKGSTQATMQTIIDAVEKHVPANASLFCTGYNPLVNFWTLRQNPTRYNTWLYPYLHREEESREVISLLETRNDAYVMLFAPDRGSPLGMWVIGNYRLLWRSSFADLYGPPSS